MKSNSKTYLIKIESHIDLNWSNWFDNVEVQFNADGHTIIIGSLPDQTALFGALMKIRDLGLSLVEVKILTQQSEISGETE